MVASVSGILQTKLVPPPVRADRIPRPRLTRRFSVSLERPLVLVCAPAGYGKTTLLSEWLVSDAGRDISFAWLSLDEDDNDPARFLTYFISSLTSLDGIDSKEILSLLNSPQAPAPRTMLTVLLSHLEAFPQPLVLVLDDYHVIATQAVHDAVTFLLEHLPPQVHLVLISREDPPFPLARLRGRNQLAEIRADDLRFTADEAAAFLEMSLGIHLNTQQLAELERRTEGWIAGLQLAALAMKGREDIAGFISAFTGSHRFILDYLIEEVLSRQTEDLQNFLLETSILNRLSGPLCNAVTGRADGQPTLELIERVNLFLIPLDDQRYWYRYHHLFMEVLRKTLKRVKASEIDELHRRASQWLAGENLIDEAVAHAIAIHDFELAASIMEGSGNQYFVDNWHSFGVKSNVAIPDEVLLRHPLLAINIGMWHGFLGRAALAKKHVAIARAGLTTLSLPMPEMEALTGYADTMEAMSAIVNNEMEQAFEAAENALRRLPEHQIHLRATALVVKGHVYQRRYLLQESRANYSQVVEIGQRLRDVSWTTRAMVHIGDTYVLEGRLREAEVTYRRVIQEAVEAKKENVLILNVGIAYGGLALILFEQNQLEAAATYAQQCIERCEEILPYHALMGHAVLARIYRISGDIAACQRAIESIRLIVDNYPSMASRTYVLHVTHLWVRDEAFAPFRRFFLDLHSQPPSPFDAHLLQLATIRDLITQAGDTSLRQALSLLADLRKSAEFTNSIARQLEVLMLEGLALNAQDRAEWALDTLEHAVELAEPEGYIRTFVDEGAPMADLLRLARSQRIAMDYVNRLLGTFDGQTPSRNGALSRQWIGDGLEPLSERELEVLHLIAGGASNGEIAQRLVISIGTVKKHVNNIFVKLDARSRTQVVAIARQYDLL